MSDENIANIKQLVKFMDEEAVTWNREDSTQKTVHGKGIQQQWDDQTEFPCVIFYLMYNTVEYTGDDDIPAFVHPDGTTVPGGRRAQFDLKGMWFDEDGNVTERPETITND